MLPEHIVALLRRPGNEWTHDDRVRLVTFLAEDKPHARYFRAVAARALLKATNRGAAALTTDLPDVINEFFGIEFEKRVRNWRPGTPPDALSLGKQLRAFLSVCLYRASLRHGLKLGRDWWNEEPIERPTAEGDVVCVEPLAESARHLLDRLNRTIDFERAAARLAPVDLLLLRLVIQGRSGREIAAALSEHEGQTVTANAVNVRKFHLRNRVRELMLGAAAPEPSQETGAPDAIDV